MDKHSDRPKMDPQAAYASEERFKALVNATSDVIYSLSADWEIMRELDGRGFLKDAMEPTTAWKSRNIHPEHRELVDNTIAEAIRFKKIFQLEHKVLRADGSPGWTFSRAVPILNEHGEILEWFGTASDITERKNAESALREIRERSDQQKRVYETITSTTPDLMYVFDLEYRFTYANKALLSMWGRSWDDAIGKGLLENGYEPWHAQMHQREIDQVRATGKPIRGEVSFPHATLGIRVYDYILTPVFNEEGLVEAVAGTTRDVTDRKESEQKLQESAEEFQAINEEYATINEELAASNEELTSTIDELAQVNSELIASQDIIEEGRTALRLAIDAANFGTWFIHSVTREFVTDARLKELFGYFPDEDLSIEQALAQITEEYRGMVATKLENAIYNNGDYDVTYPVLGLHDNRLRWLRAIGNLKADRSGSFSAFTGVVMDITENYLAVQKIAEAEEGMRMAIESGELATWYLNEKLGTITASARFNQLFGFDINEQVPYSAAVDQILPGYRELVLQAVQASFSTGAGFNIEYPITTYHEGKQRWVRSVGKFVEDKKNGNYITGVMADISEQKMDEIRKNDFIGMVSHELKTPLTSLSAIIQISQVKLKNSSDEFLASAMAKASAQVKRMSAMINGFLNISRLESGKLSIEKTSFDIRELIAETIEEFEITAPGHRIILGDCGSLMVSADREKIHSVISNLLSNAVKYSPAASEINVTCSVQGNEVILGVKDSGIGINALDSAKIFERYFRVDSNQTQNISGFGIGLYLSAEVVKYHGGRIWLESEPGRGSVFYFSLPIN